MNIANSTRKYQFIAELGHGGSGQVYLSVSSGPAGFQKLQVVKLLKDEQASVPEIVEMFLQEARLSARLNHPNIVQINEVGEEDGRYFMAMEYLDGQPLEKIMRRVAALGAPTEETQNLLLRVISSALGGLHYAHSLKDFDGTPISIIHRDVSPHNIVVTYDGQVKVLDFGIAKVAGHTVNTETGTIKGKIRYMSPEQAAPHHELDRRSDVFAMGVILFEILTEQRYWSGMSDNAILLALMRGDVQVSARAVKPTIPEELERICARALAISTAERYATAAEMQLDLNAYLARTGGHDLDQKLASALEAWFSADRQKMREIIDAQLRLLNVSSDGAIAKIRLASIPPWGSAEGSESHRARKEDSGAKAGQTAQVLPMPSAKPTSKYFRTSLMLAVVGIAAIVGVTSIALRARNVSAIAAAGTASSGPARQLVEVTIEVDPPLARIFVDDVQVPTNPFRGRFVMEHAMHMVRAESAGFVTHKQTVAFDADATVSIRLEREAVVTLDASSPSLPDAQAKAPVRSSARPDSRIPKKGIHAFDTADPFAK